MATKYNKTPTSYSGRIYPLQIYTEATSNDPIEFWINPSECQWSINYRTSIEQIQGGVVHHEWWSTGGWSGQTSDKVKQVILNLTFQSGNIIPKGYTDTSEGQVSEDIPVGLGNFYDFLEILNQPAEQKDGSPNYVHIIYTSPIFARFNLKGFFSSEGVQWSDQAESPSMINNWGASFVVFGSHPAINDANQLRQQFDSFRLFIS